MDFIINFFFILFLTIYAIIIVDILLTFLEVIFATSLRIKFIKDITETLYSQIRKIINTQIGYFDFAPMIIIILMQIILEILLYFY